MTEVTTQFAIDYLLDDCHDCPENEDGECLTKSHCFEVKRLAIKALKQYGVLQEIQKEIDETPIGNKSAYEITLLNAYRFRIHQIIDKHIKEIEE